MTKKFISVSAICGLFAVNFFFYSCGGGEQKEVVLDEQETTDTLSVDTKASLGSISVNIPLPLEISGEISGAGINYNKSLLNSGSKASGYSTNYQKALNLGVYGTDLGYCTGFQQLQDALEYLGAIKKLAEGVGIASAFDEATIKQVVESMGKEDTTGKTAALIKDAFGKAERNLRSHDRIAVVALMFCGGWVEGLYIVTQAIGTTERNSKTEKLYTRIWNQAFSFQYVIELLN